MRYLISVLISIGNPPTYMYIMYYVISLLICVFISIGNLPNITAQTEDLKFSMHVTTLVKSIYVFSV